MMSFDLQPTLRGRLVELQPLQERDYNSLYDVASDPLIWLQHPRPDRYRQSEFKAFFDDALKSAGTLVCTDLESGKIIGSSRFHDYREDTSQIEIGWTFLARTHWGGVFNGEMKRLMLKHAFRFVDSVVFLVGLENLRSQRAVGKIGGIRTGVSTDAGGNESYIYKLTASAFAEMSDRR